MILPLLFVPLVYGMSSTPDACALPPDQFFGGLGCTFTGYPEADPPVQTCCWTEEVPPGTGKDGGNTERYCQTCYYDENGNLDCEQKELQFIGTSPTPSPTPIPRGPFALPEDGAIQQPTPAPTSPLGPRPFTPLGEGTIQEPQTTPTPAPEDDQGDDGLGPFTGPLGDRVLPELEQEGKSEDGGEEKEESSIEEQPSTRE